uniref:Arrestin_C domain-containing protein n=1 Tax=Trichuris muris TaxID=70415 RepID=A0A5S6R2B6_TRIMR
MAFWPLAAREGSAKADSSRRIPMVGQREVGDLRQPFGVKENFGVNHNFCSLTTECDHRYPIDGFRWGDNNRTGLEEMATIRAAVLIPDKRATNRRTRVVAKKQKKEHPAAMNMDKVAIVIHLDQADCPVATGSELSGVVHLSYNESVLRVTDILIGLRGEARASWVSKVSDKIFDTNEVLIDQTAGSSVMPVEGVNVREKTSIPFLFRLPTELPSSIETKFGFIRYEVYVTVDVEYSQMSGCFLSPGSRQFKSLTTSRTVPVIATTGELMLSALPSLETEQKEQFDDVICCWRHSLLVLELQTPSWVLTIGQALSVRVKMVNQSHRQLTWCSLLLVRQVQFHAQSRYEDVADCRQVCTDLVCVDLPNVTTGDEYLDEVTLQVPNDLVPTSLHPCLVSVTYKLVLRVKSSTFHETGLPIYLATK